MGQICNYPNPMLSQRLLDRSLNSVLQIMSLSLLEKIPISQALSGIDDIGQNGAFCNQLNLFN